MLDFGDLLLLGALDNDSYYNDPYESFGRDYYLDEGIYPESQYARHAVVDVDPIKSESTKRKGKGGALVKRGRDYKRLEEGRRLGNAERVANQLIADKLQGLNLRRFGTRAAIGAGLAGAAGLAINAAQGDDNGNIVINPVTQAGVATAAGAGMGGLLGMATTPVATAAVPEVLAGRPGHQAVRAVSPAEQYGRRAPRRGMRGAAIGATGAALLSLASQLGKAPSPYSDVY